MRGTNWEMPRRFVPLSNRLAGVVFALVMYLETVEGWLRRCERCGRSRDGLACRGADAVPPKKPALARR